LALVLPALRMMQGLPARRLVAHLDRPAALQDLC
jgi:hypothetical protein